MNREIKFRAWDLLHQKMLNESFGMSANGDYWQYAEQGYLINTDSKKEFVLLQYTGLSDKNRKEIYEGDIIISGNKTKQVIQFGEWSVNDDMGEHSGIGFSFSGHEPFGECADGGGNMYEVIGNIYETPELLK